MLDQDHPARVRLLSQGSLPYQVPVSYLRSDSVPHVHSLSNISFTLSNPSCAIYQLYHAYSSWQMRNIVFYNK
jgi:hypothetical protein